MILPPRHDRGDRLVAAVQSSKHSGGVELTTDQRRCLNAWEEALGYVRGLVDAGWTITPPRSRHRRPTRR